MAKYTIKVKSYNNIQEDLPAAAGVTPGDLIERTSANTFQKHSTAAGVAVPRFALEDAYQGNGIATDYVAANTLISWRPTPGDVVYANFDPTSGGSCSIGDFLESAGDGSLRVQAQTSAGANEFPNSIVGQALEAATAGARFLVEII